MKEASVYDAVATSKTTRSSTGARRGVEYWDGIVPVLLLLILASVAVFAVTVWVLGAGRKMANERIVAREVLPAMFTADIRLVVDREVVSFEVMTAFKAECALGAFEWTVGGRGCWRRCRSVPAGGMVSVAVERVISKMKMARLCIVPLRRRENYQRLRARGRDKVR